MKVVQKLAGFYKHFEPLDVATGASGAIKVLMGSMTYRQALRYYCESKRERDFLLKLFELMKFSPSHPPIRLASTMTPALVSYLPLR